ncbi:MAG: protein-L-isoaspartate(D-aspartate) O-methyltransferase [Methanomicrobiales archaeon]|nr:protein-L-isoaspartate(D-aspartate) O-methyltransferase [Methanomicrobiales archaeon]
MPDYPRADERASMVARQIVARGITNPKILSAMQQIPRHIFVPPPYDRSAYDDNPLPIGSGQTISQPYIVALMTELLDPQPGDRILEIGAGSGYQAAILASLVNRVITIERLSAVAERARTTLLSLGIRNVDLVIGDGTLGYPGRAPYDGIIITAAAPHLPAPLIEQLAQGGRLVVPVGGRDFQELVVFQKNHGQLSETRYGGVRFVPLIGKYGWENEDL